MFWLCVFMCHWPFMKWRRRDFAQGGLGGCLQRKMSRGFPRTVFTFSAAGKGNVYITYPAGK